MRILTILTALLFVTSACHTPQKETKMDLSEKEKVVALLSSIATKDPVPASYINPHKYIQHNLMVGDGLAGFGSVLSLLAKGDAKVNVVRVFQDGDYVFTHTEYDFFGPKIGFDIFRFEDGMIVEHWDNLQETVTNTVSGRSQIDGLVKAVDLEKTEQNRILVTGFVNDILLNTNPQRITDYIMPELYHQHNPAVADGLEALGHAIAEMAEAGVPMTYSKNHMVLAEGNFVLAVSEGLFLGKHVAFYDLFRVENNKIVEHWDTIEEIPAREKWQNDNGKF